MKPFAKLTSRALPLLIDNIDTDQIYPSAFLTVIDKEGLVRHLFANWRYDTDGRPDPEFVLNRTDAAGARILLAGNNFGGGSSREHAAWALLGFGFRAVIAGSFADIFRANALKNGLLPVQVEPEFLATLADAITRQPGTELTIDLERRELILPGSEAVGFPIDEFSRECLLAGLDQLGYLLREEAALRAYEERHPARYDTRSIESPENR